jgi:hypothetical protein
MNLTPAERHRLVQALTEQVELDNKHAQLSDELEQIAIRCRENQEIIKSLLSKLDSESLWSVIMDLTPAERHRLVQALTEQDVVFRGAFRLRDLTFMRDSTL